MFYCMEGLVTDLLFWAITAVCMIAALVLIITVKSQSFQGRKFYAITFGAAIWILLSVGLESGTASASCQILWSKIAWLGHAILPIAWCFFVFDFLGPSTRLPPRFKTIAILGFPPIAFAVVITNPWHHLFYTEATQLLPGAAYVDYDHGPAFYTILGTLYLFAMAALWCIARGVRRAKRTAWPFLVILTIITLSPLLSNSAYVFFGVTVYGLDPTAPMFTVGILIFTWLLATNKSLDMASVGKATLFNLTSEPVLLIDRHRKVVAMNAAARRQEAADSHGTLLRNTLAIFEQQRQNDGVSHITIGERFFEPRIEKIENPMNPDGAALGWSVTFVDVTQLVMITSALEKALSEADAANRAKDEFISVINHELRTPLTSLKGGLTLALSGRFGEMPSSLQSLLEIAHRNGVRLSRLIDNLLLAQRIEIEALSLESKPVDLAALLEHSFEENHMFAAERDVELEIREVDQPAIVMGDDFAIRQIVDNLISNAIKFSTVGSVVEGQLQIANRKAKLSIRNFGEGIPAGMEAKVFGRFEQVMNVDQRSTQGSGLGLHISRKLASQMAGDIYYESQLGVDTIFHLELDLPDRDTSVSSVSKTSVVG